MFYLHLLNEGAQRDIGADVDLRPRKERGAEMGCGGEYLGGWPNIKLEMFLGLGYKSLVLVESSFANSSPPADFVTPMQHRSLYSPTGLPKSTKRTEAMKLLALATFLSLTLAAAVAPPADGIALEERDEVRASLPSLQ